MAEIKGHFNTFLFALSLLCRHPSHNETDTISTEFFYFYFITCPGKFLVQRMKKSALISRGQDIQETQADILEQNCN